MPQFQSIYSEGNPTHLKFEAKDGEIYIPITPNVPFTYTDHGKNGWSEVTVIEDEHGNMKINSKGKKDL